MTKNCLCCGVGGQGVVLSSKLIAFAAMKKGYFVRTTDTIGMAQRGGSVVSHTRMGDKVYSPMVPFHAADVILGFEPGEAVRALAYLKDDGIMVVNTKTVNPVTATLGGSDYFGQAMIDFLRKNVKNLFLIDGEAIAKACGSSKVLNIALLGAAIKSGALDISMDEIEAALEENLPQRFLAMNLKALALGAKEEQE